MLALCRSWIDILHDFENVALTYVDNRDWATNVTNLIGEFAIGIASEQSVTNFGYQLLRYKL